MLTYGQKTSQDASRMTFWDETLLFHHVFSLLPMFFLGIILFKNCVRQQPHTKCERTTDSWIMKHEFVSDAAWFL